MATRLSRFKRVKKPPKKKKSRIQNHDRVNLEPRHLFLYLSIGKMPTCSHVTSSFISRLAKCQPAATPPLPLSLDWQTAGLLHRITRPHRAQRFPLLVPVVIQTKWHFRVFEQSQHAIDYRSVEEWMHFAPF